MLVNIRNGHKIYQHFSNQRPAKIFPNWDFCFENEPSGNPEEEKEEVRFHF
jgi:hypothetical protein